MPINAPTAYQEVVVAHQRADGILLQYALRIHSRALNETVGTLELPAESPGPGSDPLHAGVNAAAARGDLRIQTEHESN